MADTQERIYHAVAIGHRTKHTCPVCKAPFLATEEHGWKARIDKRLVNVCSYSCQRLIERQEEQANRAQCEIDAAQYAAQEAKWQKKQEEKERSRRWRETHTGRWNTYRENLQVCERKLAELAAERKDPAYETASKRERASNAEKTHYWTARKKAYAQMIARQSSQT